ncbi:MAG: hypothetical protein ACYTGQ_10015, partial [Planctomycetota bacterium]
GEPAVFPVFVGRAVSQLDTPRGSAPVLGFDMMWVFAILALVIWGFWRAHRLRRYINNPERSPLVRYRRQRDQAKQDTNATDVIGARDPTELLPDDPAEAMGQLYDPTHYEPPDTPDTPTE